MELCSIWDIRVTPTFYFLKDGEQLDKMIGSKQPELEQKVARFAATNASS
ncbi:hypothetical protein HPP92_022867 [Vanilla planifolia]|uniref:Thioredoxin domain-containing protein n=1 Tax=Vanilla planifolia TaxID=51239 RepID=A0A835PSA8_VANPL|nr:hypothetical protein HPP92_022867 [Vanilla planifolia]